MPKFRFQQVLSTQPSTEVVSVEAAIDSYNPAFHRPCAGGGPQLTATNSQRSCLKLSVRPVRAAAACRPANLIVRFSKAHVASIDTGSMESFVLLFW